MCLEAIWSANYEEDFTFRKNLFNTFKSICSENGLANVLNYLWVKKCQLSSSAWWF